MNMNSLNSVFSALSEQEIFNFLREYGRESYIVGGFLREVLLGRKIYDIDVAIADSAEHIAREFADYIGGSFVVLDDENGIFRVVLEGYPHFDFTQIVGDINGDLARRDFSINAMALDIHRMIVIDPFRGLDDMGKRLLRATSRKILKEDPVRILRAVRISAALDFEIEKETLSWIKEDAHFLRGSAFERIRDEFFKILDLDESWESLLLMDELNIMKEILPELGDMKGVAQNSYHRFPVWEHSIATVKELENLLGNLEETGEASQFVKDYISKSLSGERRRCPLMKMTALLHDVGKPVTQDERCKKVTFIGHEKVGAEIADSISKRFKLSQRESQILKKTIRHHLRPIFLGREEEPSARAIYRFFRDVKDAAVEILLVSWADVEAGRGPSLTDKMIEKHHNFVRKRLKEFFEGGNRVNPPRLLSGNEVMEILNIPSGTIVGKALAIIEQAVAEGIVTTREEAIEYLKSVDKV